MMTTESPLTKYPALLLLRMRGLDPAAAADDDDLLRAY